MPLTNQPHGTARRADARKSQDGRRRQLSELEIIEAALALARRVGIRSLTMRGLADELAVTPMAAYHYVPNKQALMDLVADSVLDRAVMPGAELGSWEDRLWAFLSQSMRELAKYPGLGEYLERSRSTPAGRRHVEQMIAVLEEAGFSPTEARKAHSAIYAYMYGRVMFQSILYEQGRSGRPRKRAPSAAISLQELASDEDVEFGYRALTAGIALLLQRQRR